MPENLTMELLTALATTAVMFVEVHYDYFTLINKCETLNSKSNNLLPTDFKLKYLNYTSDHRPITAKLLI